MSMSELLLSTSGQWTGTNSLYLPEEPTHNSSSTLVVASVAQGRFSTVSYTWSFNDKPQDGLLLFGQTDDESTIEASWVDSWHMGNKMMNCTGAIEAGNAINITGTYRIEGYPDWGWRIRLQPMESNLYLEMFNISPDGEEVLAVKATYTRS